MQKTPAQMLVAHNIAGLWSFSFNSHWEIRKIETPVRCNVTQDNSSVTHNTDVKLKGASKQRREAEEIEEALDFGVIAEIDLLSIQIRISFHTLMLRWWQSFQADLKYWKVHKDRSLIMLQKWLHRQNTDKCRHNFFKSFEGGKISQKIKCIKPYFGKTTTVLWSSEFVNKLYL